MGVVIDVDASKIFGKKNQAERPARKDNVSVLQCMNFFEFADSFYSQDESFPSWRSRVYNH